MMVMVAAACLVASPIAAQATKGTKGAGDSADGQDSQVTRPDGRRPQGNGANKDANRDVNEGIGGKASGKMGKKGPGGRGIRPDGRPDGQHGGDRRYEPSAETIRSIIEMLKDLNPEFASRLKKNPGQAHGMIRKYMQSSKIRRLLYLRKYDRKSYDLQIDDLKLAREMGAAGARYRHAKKNNDTAAMASARTRIEQLVAEQFDLRLKLRERELLNIEKRLEAMRRQLDAAKKDKNKTIASNVKAVLERTKSGDGSGHPDRAGPGFRPGGKTGSSSGRVGDHRPGREMTDEQRKVYQERLEKFRKMREANRQRDKDAN